MAPAGLVRSASRSARQYIFGSSRRRRDPLLAAVATLKMLYAEGRLVLPDRVPVGHLTKSERELIFGEGKPDRRLYEIATLSHLKNRLSSRNVWVEGSRSYRPRPTPSMPKSARYIRSSKFRTCCGKCMNGPGLPTCSPMCGQGMCHRTSPRCWPV